jgi:hypothetical protein
VESPNATEPERFIPSSPHLLKVTQPFRNLDSVPVVSNVQEIATLNAARVDFFDTVGSTTIDIQTSLKRQIGFDASFWGKDSGGHVFSGL